MSNVTDMEYNASFNQNIGNGMFQCLNMFNMFRSAITLINHIGSWDTVKCHKYDVDVYTKYLF